MSLEALLDHTCDIYHIAETQESPGYGLPSSPSFEYPVEPSIAGQICHFGVKSMSISINQKEPMNVAEGSIKLTLPYGTDVRLNDKIVDCKTGAEFTAEYPRTVRNHHVFVYLQRIQKQKAL